MGGGRDGHLLPLDLTRDRQQRHALGPFEDQRVRPALDRGWCGHEVLERAQRLDGGAGQPGLHSDLLAGDTDGHDLGEVAVQLGCDLDEAGGGAELLHDPRVPLCWAVSGGLDDLGQVLCQWLSFR